MAPVPGLPRPPGGLATTWDKSRHRGFVAFLGLLAAVATAAGVLPAVVHAADEFVILQSTTSTQNSGLFEYLLPLFEQQSGIEVRVVAVGTGQAIANARRGDGDVLLVHAQELEEQFVAEGFAAARHPLMYNDFVVVGPAADPADVRAADGAAAALRRIAGSGVRFVSRGDDSGTHIKERSLWEAAGVDVDAASGGWYVETGSGMGATLNLSAELNAYTLTDRASWISHRNPRELTLLLAGDPVLFNQYSVILVHSAQRPNPKAALGLELVEWLLSSAGQAAIGAFQIGGQPLFFPNAQDD